MARRILAEEAAWPSPDLPADDLRAAFILAEEAAWPSPDSVMGDAPHPAILAEEAAWPSPDENCCELAPPPLRTSMKCFWISGPPALEMKLRKDQFRGQNYPIIINLLRKFTKSAQS